MIKYSVEVEETAKQNQAQATRYKKQVGTCLLFRISS